MKNNEKILAAAILLSGLFCVTGCTTNQYGSVGSVTQVTSEVSESATASLEEKEAEVTDGVLTITEEGSYTVNESVDRIVVDAGKDAQVEIILDGVEINCEGTAGIYVKQADKVTIILADGSENVITNTGEFVADGDEEVNAAIYSKDDLIIKGNGSLTVTSETGHGIKSNDDLQISSGNITIDAAKDGIHAKEEVTVDGGTIRIQAAEGIESTIVTINDGDITIDASDDGINGSLKSEDIDTPKVEINGGSVKITMGQGDTDAIDSNGDIYINGGTVDITAQSAFDYDGVAEHNGGTIIVNGEEIDEITNQFGGMGQQGFGKGGPMDANQNMGNPPEGFDSGNMPEGFGQGNPPEGFGNGERPERPQKGSKQKTNQ